MFVDYIDRDYIDEIKKSYTKSYELMGRHDTVSICLAEESSDAIMFFSSGRGLDRVSSINNLYSYKIIEYYKYRGYIYLPQVSITYDEIEEYKEYLYQLVNGVNGEKIDEHILKQLEDKNLILGKEDRKIINLGENLIVVNFPITKFSNPCEFFRELMNRYLLNDPNVTDISFGYSRNDSLQVIIRFIGDIWSMKELIMNSISKPLSEHKIRFKTSEMLITAFISDLEYEALLETQIHDPADRRTLREILIKVNPRLKEDSILIRRLPYEDIAKLIKTYKFKDKIKTIQHLNEFDMDDMMAKFFRGWVHAKVKKGGETEIDTIVGDLRDLYLTIARTAENILLINLSNVQIQVGKDEFYITLSNNFKKEIKMELKQFSPKMLISATLICYRNIDHTGLSQEYISHLEKLEYNKFYNIRNAFIHSINRDFLKNMGLIEEDMNLTINALLSILEFIIKFQEKS